MNYETQNKVKFGEVWVKYPYRWQPDMAHEAYFCLAFGKECSFPMAWERIGGTVIFYDAREVKYAP